MHLKIFFPKLRKIKPIPLKGTGRHKYSFQRVEVPPFPIHFCDCEEHSGPPVSAKRNYTGDHGTDTYGVNEDELNMMKLILNKLLEKENCSKTVSNEAEVTEKINYNVTLADNWQVDENEEDQVSDEDNLVINMVGHPSKRVALFEDWGQKTTTANQDSLVREPKSFSRPIPEMHGRKKGKLLPDKKRKQPIRENYSNDSVPSKRKGMKGDPLERINDPVAVNSLPTESESGSIRLSCNVAGAHKTAWRDLVSEKGSTAFHISDILTDLNPEVEAKPRSDRLAAAPCLNENGVQGDQSSKDKELEKLADIQSTKPSAFEDKSARGASWLQKSSWLQLVGNTSNSAFNLAQILPGITFEKQELQQFDHSDFANLRNGKQHTFVRKDQNAPIEDIGKPQGRANKYIFTTPGNQNVDVLTKEQNHAGLDGEQPNSDSKQTVEVKDEASALIDGMVPNYRAVGDIVISETCPFMRSAASMKEWVKTKAALSGSHKKKGKGKELVQD
ncbi:hypothetical protein Pfo_003936 [Paulownia fortunei]|nr:hypothetical protein Pfo_003936 [Paulownia fortunei]